MACKSRNRPQDWHDPRRTWFVVVVVVIGVVFAVLKEIRQGGGADTSAVGADWVALAMWFLFTLCVIALVLCGGIWWYLRTNTVISKRNQEAIALLDAGQVAGALRLWDAMIEEEGEEGSRRIPLLYNRGVALIRLGSLDAAIEVFANLAQQRKGDSSAMRDLMDAHLALATAIRGNGEVVNVKQEPRSRKGARRAEGIWLMVEMILSLRCGDAADVLRNLKEAWSRVEGPMGVHGSKTLRLLSAFGHSQLPDAASHAKDIERLLAGVHPFRPGEFDYLVVNWPEFSAFLVEHGFVIQNSVPQPAAAPADLKPVT